MRRVDVPRELLLRHGSEGTEAALEVLQLWHLDSRIGPLSRADSRNTEQSRNAGQPKLVSDDMIAFFSLVRG